MNVWFKNRSNILELLDFLLSSELIIDKEEIISFLKYPELYSEVWELYQKEMMGKGETIIRYDNI